MKQPTKTELTELLMSEANIPLTPELVKSTMQMLWFTPYSRIGLRLSSSGHDFLSNTLKLTHYTYKIVNTPDSLKVLLQMNKYLTSPFYIKGASTIVMYGETDASMIALMGGDLGKYLENFTK